MLAHLDGVHSVMAAVRGRLRVCRVLLGGPGSNLRTAATPSRGTEWGSSNHHTEYQIMFKPTPNPPEVETDPASPYVSNDCRKLNDAANRALDHYLCPGAHVMGTTNQPEPMYFANPAYDTESLLANASESLGSASEMLSNFAATLDPTHRRTAIGIAQLVMLGELAVSQALDHVEVKS